MFTHPIVKDIHAWWNAHGSNHKSPEWQTYIGHLSELVAIKCREISEKHSNGGRFGTSKAGGCTREAALKLLGYKGEPVDGDTLVTWHIGHLLESVPIATLKTMGYTIEGVQKPVTIEPFMQSFVDGIITAGPRKDIPYPCVLSVKTQGYKFTRYSPQKGKTVRQGFPALPFDGVRNGGPGWWCQSQAEMEATGIDNSLVLVIAKDIVQAMRNDEFMIESGSLSFYAELLGRDAATASKIKEAWGCVWDYASVWNSAIDSEHGESIEVIPPMYYHKSKGFVELPEPGSKGSDKSIWCGANQEATGTFNPCGGCGFAALCRGEINDDLG